MVRQRVDEQGFIDDPQPSMLSSCNCKIKYALCILCGLSIAFGIGVYVASIMSVPSIVPLLPVTTPVINTSPLLNITSPVAELCRPSLPPTEIILKYATSTCAYLILVVYSIECYDDSNGILTINRQKQQNFNQLVDKWIKDTQKPPDTYVTKNTGVSGFSITVRHYNRDRYQESCYNGAPRNFL